MDTPTAFDERLWRRMATELGAAGLAVPEEYGGAGMGYQEVSYLAEEAGRALAPSALLATAGAMVLLSWGQARMSATRAAVILTLEPAIAALTAAALGGESLGGDSLGGEFGLRTVVGGLLLLGAMFLVELGGRRDRRTGGRRRTARPPGPTAVPGHSWRCWKAPPAD